MILLIVLLLTLVMFSTLWLLGKKRGGGAMLGATAIVWALIIGWAVWAYYAMHRQGMEGDASIAVVVAIYGVTFIAAILLVAYLALMLFKKLPRQRRV